MALTDSQLQAATDHLWLSTDPVDIKFIDSPLLYILMKQAEKADYDTYFTKASETVDGGKTLRVPLEYDDSNRGSYGRTTVIEQGKKDIINNAYFPWGGCYASNTLNLDDQVQNAGAEAIVDLSYRYIQNVLKSAWKELAEAIYSRTSGDDFAVKALVTDLFNTTGSTAYGGVAEDDMALWAANVNTDGDPISIEFLQKIWRTPAIGQSTKMRPNLGLTTETLKDGYYRTLHTQKQFMDQDLFDAGYPNVLHEGAPIIADSNFDTGYFMALNTRFLMLKAHTQYNFTDPKWINKEVLGQPDVKTINTRFMGQLVCTHRKAHVLATGVTEPD